MNMLQKKTCVNKLHLALELFEAGCEMMMLNLKRAHPHASEVEIDELYREWLHTRPGAEFGDAEGIPVDRIF